MTKALRILITGATTQTGSLAVRALLSQGHSVRCLVRTEANRRFLPATGIEVLRGDLERPETFEPALAGIDAIVHIAHIRYAPTIMAASERSGIRRVVFFSSTRIYTKFDCPTARQVREGEKAIETSTLDYTILRPSMIYGSRRDNNISRLIRYIERHSVFPLVGGGRNLVQPVFTRDVAQAVREAIERPAAVRAAYTLAGPEPMTYREMIQKIAAALGRKIRLFPVPIALVLFLVRCYERITPRPRVTSEQIRRFGEDRVFDIGPAKRDLGFAPIDFSEGVRLQIAGEVDKIWKSEDPAS